MQTNKSNQNQNPRKDADKRSSNSNVRTDSKTGSSQQNKTSSPGKMGGTTKDNSGSSNREK